MLSELKFQADMGILLTFMFLVNMVGAIVLLPAMATDRPALPRAPGTDAASRRSGIGRSGIGPWIGVLADALLVGLVLICVLAALCAWLGSVAAVIGLALWSAAGLGAGVRVIGRRRSAGAAQDLRLPLPEQIGRASCRERV